MYVSAPRTVEELRECEREYNIAGFPGCIGSTDATHTPLEKVCMSMRQAHLGHKSKVTMRTYNLTCNHRRKILHTTEGHPARWNDKTLIRFDNFMSELCNGALNEKFDFELTRQGMTIDDDGEDRTLKLRGAYVMVDNGYLEWSTTVLPLKASCNRSELRFSQWLESMRKDVECTFGILKGRWRMLKTGIRLYNTEIADNIWLTCCCASHNMLLDVDDLSKSWNNGVRSRWELEGGEFGADDVPFAIHRLVDPTGTEEFRLRQYDGSRFGYQRLPTLGIDNEEDESENDDGNRSHRRNCRRGNHSNATASCRIQRGRIESGIAVNELNFFQFRSLLIDNFNIRYHENNVQWPRRLAHSTPRHVPVLIAA